MSMSEWPMFLDISKDDCKRFLRRLELEAYSSLVSAFRAQGDLTKDKKKVLQELCTILGISTERHRAEVRRAVNCERLATVADAVSGCSDYSEWAIEGRRLVPLMPRLVPQTAFTSIANANAAIAAHQNSHLPPPSATNNMKENLPIPLNNLAAVVKVPTKPAPVNDYVQRVSPPAACHVAGGSNIFVSQQEVVVSTSLDVETENDVTESPVVSNLEEPPRKRPRALSNDSGDAVSRLVVKANTPVSSTEVATVSPAPTLSSTAACPRMVNVPIEGTPLKFTLTGTSSSPKLTATASSSASTVYPAKKVFLVSTSGANLSSSILQRSLTVPVMKTIGGSPSSATVSSQSAFRPTPSLITPISSSTPVSLVLSTSPATLTTSQSTGCTSLKIIAQTVPVSAATKLGSKVTLGGGMPPIVVVTKTPLGKGQSSSTRLVNMIGAQSSTVKRGGPSLVALGPKNKQTALVKVAPGMSFATATGKPNVYVVQKSHMLQQLKQSQPGSAFAISAASFSSTQTMLRASLSKEGFRLPAVAVPKSRLSSPTVTATTVGGGDGPTSRKSSVLADLLQATGILPESGGGAVQMETSDATDQSIVSAGDEGHGDDATAVDRLVDECAVDISSFVERLQCKESHHSSADDRSPEPAKTKSGAALQMESGLLDPQTGRFSAYPVDCTEESLGHSSRVDDQQKRIGSLSLAALIQGSIADGVGKGSATTAEGSVSRRESPIDRRDLRSTGESTTEPSAAESFSQSIRTYLYKGGTTTTRGMTYSKGDVASHRKKVNECLPFGGSVGEEVSTTKCSVEPDSVDVAIDGVAASSNEQEFHFADDDFVEETVVTTDDSSTATGVELALRRAEEEIQMDVAVHTERFASSRATLVTEHLPRIVTHSTSGPCSSVFMVSDSSLGSDTGQLDAVEGGLQSPYIIQQDVEGGSETLEIIGSTEDFESVESRVAALHGEGDFSEDRDRPSTTVDAASPSKKKKTASAADSSWYRAATGLLQRVMKFRGPNRFKGERGAAHWFLHPVSAEDAPGYHKIVKRPMDFTTILKKLERSAYKSIADFHEDMLLVKHNCELYNPVDHPARQDCDCVFAFYRQEYGKLLSKTHGTASLQKKRTT